MREKSVYAGKTVKIKNGVGKGLMVPDMSGMDFVVEDWAENLLGCPWWAANGNPAAMEYAVRTGVNGRNNNVPDDDEVLGGKVGIYSHLFHVNELELNPEKNSHDWILLCEQVPQIQRKVLLSLKDMDICTGFRADTEGFFLVESGGFIKSEYVLAWQPLPDPYKMVDKEVPDGKAD